MLPIARTRPTLILAAIVAGVLLCGATAAHAAFLPEQCLAGKLKAWGNLRKCQRTEDGKAVLFKPSDLAKCQTKFQTAVGKLNDKAADSGIPCRYRDNGNTTVTDFDTGLMWEQKIDDGGFRDKDSVFPWADAMSEFVSAVNGYSDSTGAHVGAGGYTDWRLPDRAELLTIVDSTQGLCGGGSGACILPIFGPTVTAIFYWSATTTASFPGSASAVRFSNGSTTSAAKSITSAVRAVRTAF